MIEGRGVRGGGAAVGDYLVFFGGEAATDGRGEREVLLLGFLGAWVGVGLDGEDGVGGSKLVRVKGGEVAAVGIFDEEGTPDVLVGNTREELAVFGGVVCGGIRGIGWEGGDCS